MKIPVIYGNNQVVQERQLFDHCESPSARKPKELAEKLRSFDWIEFFDPKPLTINDLKLAHNSDYVDGIMNLQIKNGFGNKSREIADSLLYTNGAMYDAAIKATSALPCAALVSGFHHAGWDGWENLGYFCTFNGLMVTAAKLIQELNYRVAILDADMHWGNGTDHILFELPELRKNVYHFSFGEHFAQRTDHIEYLNHIDKIQKELKEFDPDVILYQAGADPHVDDPYGGILTTEEMMERDKRIFSLAKSLNVPLAWDLAGGYQIDKDGNIDKILELHINTFKACREIYEL